MIKKIQFYTGGCPRSEITGKNLRKAVEQLGLEVEIESTDDPKIFEQHGVFTFPAVRVDGEIKSEGPFLTVDACKELLSSYL